MSKIFIRYFKYLIKPKYYDVINRESLLHKLFKTFYVLVILLVLTIISIVLKKILSDLDLLPVAKNIGFENFTKDNSLLKTFLVACILGPIIEELAFRFYLIIRPINISISISFLFYYFVPKFSNLTISPRSFLVLKTAITAFLFIIIFLVLRNRDKLLEKIKSIWNKYFVVIFYCSLLIFVLPHLKNYEFNLKHILFIPIYLLPQFIGGYSFMYVRMHYGILFSIILHMLANFIPFLTVFLK